jgi:hypothetical protein
MKEGKVKNDMSVTHPPEAFSCLAEIHNSVITALYHIAAAKYQSLG